MRRSAIVIALALAGGACGGPPQPRQIIETSSTFDDRLPVLLRQKDPGFALEAIVAGVLTRDGPCLYVGWGDQKQLIVWADEVRVGRLDEHGWVVSNDSTNQRYTEGDFIEGGGGTLPPGDPASKYTADPVPAECAGSAVQMHGVRKDPSRARPAPPGAAAREVPPAPPPPPRPQDLQGRPVAALTQPDALAALFRHQFGNNASGQQQDTGAYCLEVEGKDPPPDYLRRFAAVTPPVHPGSACEFRQPQVVLKADGSPALVHFVSSLSCQGNVCEARGGYREANLSSSVNRYRLEYRSGRWQVTQDFIEAIS